MDGEGVIQLVINGVLAGFVFSLVSIGLTLIYGVMGIVNFAHGSLLMMSMYLTYVLFVSLGLDPLFSLPISTVALSLMGIAIYKLVIRKTLLSSRTTQLLATFGLMVLFTNGAQFIFTSDYRLVKNPLVSGRVNLLGTYIGLPQVVASVGCLIAAGLVYYLVNMTETGRALMATAEDRDAAALMGVNVEQMYVIAWAVGAACVGFAGGLLANYYYIYPQVGDVFGTVAVITVALGGFGSIQGALVAGILVGLVMVIGGYLVGPAHKYTIVYLSYFVALFLRPRGLFGRG